MAVIQDIWIFGTGEVHWKFETGRAAGDTEQEIGKDGVGLRDGPNHSHITSSNSSLTCCFMERFRTKMQINN